MKNKVDCAKRLIKIEKTYERELRSWDKNRISFKEVFNIGELV